MTSYSIDFALGGRWPTNSIRVRPWNICKFNNHKVFKHLTVFVYEIFPFSSDLFRKYFLDDCVYRFYVCTERLGTWPYNRNKCVKLFHKCDQHITSKRQSLLIPSASTQLIPTAEAIKSK